LDAILKIIYTASTETEPTFRLIAYNVFYSTAFLMLLAI